LQHWKDITFLDLAIRAQLANTIFQLLLVIDAKWAKDTKIQGLQNMSCMRGETNQVNIVVDSMIDEVVVFNMS